MASESETKQDGDFNPDSFSRVRVAGGERQGGKQYQEDSHFHWTSPRGAVVVASIFDGHGGLNGAVASQTARQVALDYLVARQTECETWDDDTWGRRLEELFEVIHESIRKQLVEKRDTLSGSMSSGPRSIDEKGIVRFPSGEPVHGGSTGTMVVLRRFRGSGDSQPSFSIISANVGDSTAIMLPEKGKFSFLTVDHGPENKEEFLRIQKLDPKQHPEKLMFVYDKTSVFRKYDCPKVFLDDGNKDPVFVTNPWGNGLHPTNVRYEPAVYAVTPRTVSRDTTCIAMTRALGDFYAHQFGLTYHPSIVVTRPPPGMRFILAVASDGIWDCWRYEDLLEYINARYAPDKSLESLNETTLNESIQRAITNFGSKHYDDASMILVECTPLNSE